MPKKSDSSDARRAQHPIETVRVWPTGIIKAPQPLPGQKKSPAK